MRGAQHGAVSLPGEAWRPAVNKEISHEVSSEGRVRRVCTCSGRPLPAPVLISPRPNHGGYLYVPLWEGGRRRFRPVHHLVLLAFVGARPDGYEADHIDANRQNNRPSNLRWLTRSENCAHRLALGNVPRKLSPDQVRLIRTATHRTLADLAQEFGVHRSTVGRIRQRQRQKGVL